MTDSRYQHGRIHTGFVRLSRVLLLAAATLGFHHFGFAQEEPATREIEMTGSIDVTNNGISTIPTFTLGKPAIAFDASIRSRRVAFQPEFRFSLEGQPWSFLFPWQYTVLSTDRGYLNVAVRPILSFKTSPLARDGLVEDVVEARRFLAGVVRTEGYLTPHLAAGVYYFYSRGFQSSTQRHTHFLSATGGIRGLDLSRRVRLSINPQVYYLRLDDLGGFFTAANVVLSRQGWPLSASTLLNAKLRSDLAADDFVWNVSLTYSYEL